MKRAAQNMAIVHDAATTTASKMRSFHLQAKWMCILFHSILYAYVACVARVRSRTIRARRSFHSVQYVHICACLCVEGRGRGAVMRFLLTDW